MERLRLVRTLARVLARHNTDRRSWCVQGRERKRRRRRSPRRRRWRSQSLLGLVFQSSSRMASIRRASFRSTRTSELDYIGGMSAY